MFLKALTIKGFKSFADKTTLEFEPGVTVVIGPNGSGKSNVVDSVAWVLGAQGARALRGGKMDDVIFAGTSQRSALGRAEVGLTIDNTSRLLPIEFSEVTITRTLFRTGESEYQINGTPCRLLDIQELLSDSGIGRTQHVIVGQGQLDTVLNARPEDRRAIIEEAAGILKYRKRKEKAERRLDSTETTLMRLNDLAREVRRQLRPLERQADAARRHDGLADELRSIRLHLVGRELDSQRSRLERSRQQRSEFTTHENQLRGRLHGLDAQVTEAEQALSLPGEDDVADVLARVEALRERGRGLQALVAERVRGIDRDLDAAADEGVVETLVADASAARAELVEVAAEHESLFEVRAELERAESAAQIAETLLGTMQSRDGQSPLERELHEAESAVEEAGAAARAAEQVGVALASRADAIAADEPAIRIELEEVEKKLSQVAPEREELVEQERLVDALKSAFDSDSAVAIEDTPVGQSKRVSEENVERWTKAVHAAQELASRWRSRAETLAHALADMQNSNGAERIGSVAGVVGPLIDHLQIDDGMEIAVAAALGDALEAVVVDGRDPARAAIERLKDGDAQALLVVISDHAKAQELSLGVPSGCRSLLDFVRAPGRPGINEVLASILANVVLVDGGWMSALDVALADSRFVAVTRDGDRFGGGRVWRAGAPGRGAVTPAAVHDANSHADEAEASLEIANAELSTSRVALDTARHAEAAFSSALRARKVEVDRASQEVIGRRRAFDRSTAALDERQASLVRRLADSAERGADLPALRVEADEAATLANNALDEARDRLVRVRHAEVAMNAQTSERRAEYDSARHLATSLRRDFDVRSASIEQRRNGLTRRLEEIERRLALRPDEEAAANRRRANLTSKKSRIEIIGVSLGERMETANELTDRLRDERRRQSEAARAAGGRLEGLRAERADTERRFTELRERHNRVEIEETECKIRLEQAVETVRREFDCEPEVAIATPAPESVAGLDLAQRARDLEREVRLLGPINPLALAEYESLVERSEFLAQQLDDVKNSRRELHRVIQSVNSEISAIFKEAFDDVSADFSELFSLLFPGGSGRITLSAPDNLLDSGVDIEARPSGKTPRRLSLLSGGERSLAALAYLFAVFRARPSPFYILDEVEAALDDVNLQRFLSLVEEFRKDAQLLIVSHQKRTMEAADILYGVSMPPGGSSRVVSQRVRDIAFEDA